MKKQQKVAIAVDWLTEGFGGGERVIKAIHDMYPDAPIYTSQYRPKRTTWLGAADVRTGLLNILPVGIRRFTPFLRQWYFARLDLTAYDLVISVTGAEAKAVRTRADAIHLSYMHAPTQYYWTLYDAYIKNPGFGVLNPLARVVLKTIIGPLRRADYAAAQRPDTVVTISSYTQEEIRTHYGRESIVIAPPVDVESINGCVQSTTQRSGFIIACRQVVWKRVDLAISAALRAQVRLTVVGDGPEHDRLIQLAAGSSLITFLPKYKDIGEIVDLLAASQAFVFPSLEPFGIAPVEALAAGTPVIALQKGGALDFIREGSNGVFFANQTIESLTDAFRRFSTLSFDEKEVADTAKKFSQAVFKKELESLIETRSGV